MKQFLYLYVQEMKMEEKEEENRDSNFPYKKREHVALPLRGLLRFIMQKQANIEIKEVE